MQSEAVEQSIPGFQSKLKLSSLHNPLRIRSEGIDDSVESHLQKTNNSIEPTFISAIPKLNNTDQTDHP